MNLKDYQDKLILPIVDQNILNLKTNLDKQTLLFKEYFPFKISIGSNIEDNDNEYSIEKLTMEIALVQ